MEVIKGVLAIMCLGFGVYAFKDKRNGDGLMGILISAACFYSLFNPPA